MELLSLAVGFVLLAVGGEYLVRSAVELAARLGVPPLLVGFTIVAAATSAPELVVGVQAAIAGTPTIVLGNIAGANVANLGLGLGAMALVRPFRAHRGSLARDIRLLLAVTVAFTLLGLTLGFTRLVAAVAVIALGTHLWRSYRWHVRNADASERTEIVADARGEAWPLPRSLWILALSVTALVLGAHWLLEAAVSLAQAWGVSDTVVGASVVALGTTLPETATATIASLRGRPGVALGNLVGSCLFNLLGILGATTLIAPFMPQPGFVAVSGTAMFAFAILAAPLLTGKVRASRPLGLLMLAGYAVYIALLTGAVVPL